ncbi:MAG: hypothetical protein BWX80_00944 [Candidatus Hydrogenedentes bacterium ADurb.Bin101]|nr:MAG: hypothetical protein BWX80_00944 [Candidatus Hydrogenedentes bacterium ADurb.Bin101]HOC69549.1 hypothetical protein [Candidatus Hydrogenedentota bacterium]
MKANKYGAKDVILRAFGDIVRYITGSGIFAFVVDCIILLVGRNKYKTEIYYFIFIWIFAIATFSFIMLLLFI